MTAFMGNGSEIDEYPGLASSRPWREKKDYGTETQADRQSRRYAQREKARNFAEKAEPGRNKRTPVSELAVYAMLAVYWQNEAST